MRYLSIYTTVERNTPPCPDDVGKMGAFIEEMTRAGVLLAPEGCKPSALGARVRQAGGQTTVTDGPFTETKELIAGFALLEAASLDEAVAWSKRFLAVAGDGETEIRALYSPEDFEFADSASAASATAS